MPPTPPLRATPARRRQRWTPPADGASTVDGGGEVEAGDAAVEAAAPCPPGLTLGASGCVFTNPFADPSFTGAPLGAWSMTRGARLYTGDGPSGPGFVRLADDVALPSYRHGAVAQTITLPTYEQAGPLAWVASGSLAVRALTEYPLIPFLDGVAALDGRAILASAENTTVHPRVCLGEAAYGRTTTFVVTTSGFFDRLDVDAFDLVSEPTCPRPGRLMNGDFETAGGFTFSTSKKLKLLSGRGTDGSRAATCVAGPQGSDDHLFASLSIPEVGVNAVTMRTYGTGNIRVAVDRRELARLRVDPSRTTQTVCLPRWLRGVVLDLELGCGQRFFQHSSEAADEFAIDDVAFANLPACEDDVAVANLGFETPGEPIPGWFTTRYPEAIVAREVAEPHGGAGYLSLRTTAAWCGATSTQVPVANAAIVAPPWNAATGGPRVRFWYRFTSAADMRASVATNLGNESLLPPAATWTRHVKCMHRVQPGLRAEVRFELREARPACDAATLDVDDVEIVADPSCPVE